MTRKDIYASYLNDCDRDFKTQKRKNTIRAFENKKSRSHGNDATKNDSRNAYRSSTMLQRDPSLPPCQPSFYMHEAH